MSHDCALSHECIDAHVTQRLGLCQVIPPYCSAFRCDECSPSICTPCTCAVPQQHRHEWSLPSDCTWCDGKDCRRSCSSCRRIECSACNRGVGGLRRVPTPYPATPTISRAACPLSSALPSVKYSSAIHRLLLSPQHHGKLHLRSSITADHFALCDDGASVSCNKFNIGALPGTFIKDDTDPLAVGDEDSVLDCLGSYLCAITLVDARGVEYDMLRRLYYTPTAIADVILSETVEVFSHDAEFHFTNRGRSMLTDSSQLRMGFSPNGLGWFGVKPVPPSRLKALLSTASSADLLHAFPTTPPFVANGAAPHFVTLDVQDAFHQFPLDPTDVTAGHVVLAVSHGTASSPAPDTSTLPLDLDSECATLALELTPFASLDLPALVSSRRLLLSTLLRSVPTEQLSSTLEGGKGGGSSSSPLRPLLLSPLVRFFIFSVPSCFASHTTPQTRFISRARVLRRARTLIFTRLTFLFLRHRPARDRSHSLASAPTAPFASFCYRATLRRRLRKARNDRPTDSSLPASSAPPPGDFLEQQLNPPTPRDHNKGRTRACLVLVEGFKVLTLLIDKSKYSLPGGPIARHFHLRPRDAATENFCAVFGQPAPRLDALIRSTARRYGTGHTQFFIIRVPDDFPTLLDELPRSPPLASFMMFEVSTSWLDVRSLVVPAFTEPDDTAFFTRVRNLSLGHKGPLQLSSIFAPTPLPAAALVAAAPYLLGDAPVDPCTDPSSAGPAFHDQRSSSWAAMRLMERSLSLPGSPRVIALDIEGRLTLHHGSVELIQLCLSRAPGEHSDHVHVFDIRRDPSPLYDSRSPLRAWITNSTIVKVAHCCRGDTSVLFSRYGIMPVAFFDTGVADSLLRGRHPFSPRSLGTVLAHYVPGCVMEHKGKFNHESDTWTRRPITRRLFEYAYQDVIFCVKLYDALVASLLVTTGTAFPNRLIDLCFTLTRVNLPPYILHPTAALAVTPSRAVAILHDGESFLCLHDSTNPDKLLLPDFPLDLTPFANVSIHQRHRHSFRAAWGTYFGPPSKTGGLRVSLNARSRKSLVFPHFHIFEIECHHLGTVTEGMMQFLPSGTLPRRFLLSDFPFLPSIGDLDSFSNEHACALLYLLHLREHTSRCRRRLLPEPITDATVLCLSSGLHKAALSLKASPAFGSRTGGPPRYHLLLRDATHCLILECPGNGMPKFILPWSRASSPTLTGRPSAFHGLESMLGPLTRYSPRFGHHARVCTLRGRLLDDSDANPIYECRIDPHYSLGPYVSDLFVAFRNRSASQSILALSIDWRIVTLEAALPMLGHFAAHALSVSNSPPPAAAPSTAPSIISCCLLILTDSLRGPEFVCPASTSHLSDGFVVNLTPGQSYGEALLALLPPILLSSSELVHSLHCTLASRPDGSVCFEGNPATDFVRRHVWCIHLTPAASTFLPAEFSRHRMCDFFSSLRDVSDRFDYCQCCETAVNTAIRTAYPRRTTSPAAVFVPARSSGSCSRPPPPSALTAASAVALPRLPLCSAALASDSPFRVPSLPLITATAAETISNWSLYCSLSGRELPPDLSHRVRPCNTTPMFALADALITIRSQPDDTPDICIADRNARLLLAFSLVLASLPPHTSSLVLATSNRADNVPGTVPSSFTDAPGDPLDGSEPTWDGVADGSGEPELFGGQTEFHGRPRQHASSSSNIPRPPTLAEIISEQRTCEKYRHVYAYLLDGPAYALAPGDNGAPPIPDIESSCAGIRMIDGILVWTRSPKSSSATRSAPFRIILPDRFHSWALHTYHDLSGHFGVHRTYGLIARRYYWPNLRDSVRAHTRNCGVCARCKVSRTRVGSFHLPGDGNHAWDVVTMDLYYVGYSDNGFDHILIFADQFGRAVTCVPTRGTPTSREVFDFYRFYVARYHGYPSRIRTDHGSIFVSEIIKQAWAALSVHMEVSTAEHHETVGLAERFNAVLHDFLLTHRCASADPRWTRYIIDFEMMFNATIASRTGFSPFYIDHGREFPLPYDVVYYGIASAPPDIDVYVAGFLDRMQAAWLACREAALRSSLNSKLSYDKNRDTVLKYMVGQRVMVIKARRFNGRAVTKWDEPTHGPYRISEALPYDNYRLRDLPNRRLHDKFHVSRLSPYPLLTNDGDAVPCDDDDFVDRILARRLSSSDSDPTDPSSYLYKVRWLGKPAASDTWHPLRALGSCIDLVNAFNTIHPIPVADLPREGQDLSDMTRPTPHASEWRTRRSIPQVPPPAVSPGDIDAEPPSTPAPSASADADPCSAIPLPPSAPVESPSAESNWYRRFSTELRRLSDLEASTSADISTSADPSAVTVPHIVDPPVGGLPVPDVPWLCTSCGYTNPGGPHCASCRHSRELFGVIADPPSGRPSRVPSSTLDVTDALQLRAIYGHPFAHLYGPFRHRINSEYKDGPNSKPRSVSEYELSRLQGAMRHRVWVYPGLQGKALTTDERNRVRAYRFDHPSAQ